MAMWAANWRKLNETAANLSHCAADASAASPEAAAAVESLRQELDKAVNDDLSLHRFWPQLFAFCRKANAAASPKRAAYADAAAYLEGLKAVDAVLGVIDHSQMPLPRADWPEAATELAARREKARAKKDFAQADDLRAGIEALGLRVEDTASGPRLYAARK